MKTINRILIGFGLIGLSVSSVFAEAYKQDFGALTAYIEIEKNHFLVVEGGRVTTIGDPDGFYGIQDGQVNRIALLTDRDYQKIYRRSKGNFGKMTGQFPWRRTSKDKTISNRSGNPYQSLKKAAFIESTELWLIKKIRDMLKRNIEFHIVWGAQEAWVSLSFKASRLLVTENDKQITEDFKVVQKPSIRHHHIKIDESIKTPFPKNH